MKKVKDIMTENPACCTSETSLQDVAHMMMENDCGEIPVVDSAQSRRPIGVITDRDIVCRAVAQGKNTLSLTAGDCMTNPCLTVSPDNTLDECIKVLEESQIRRVPVVDASGSCCGIVAQADIARMAKKQVAELVQKVSA